MLGYIWFAHLEYQFVSSVLSEVVMSWQLSAIAWQHAVTGSGSVGAGPHGPTVRGDPSPAQGSVPLGAMPLMNVPP